MAIRVNWNQGKISADKLIRVHKIKLRQPKSCQFRSMKGDYNDYPNVLRAEAAMKRAGFRKYKHCSHCWDGQVIDPIP